MVKKKSVTIFADDLDSRSKEQFRICYEKDFVVAASLMPDAHAGYVAPIGSVLVSRGFVVPAWVGYDIGCGVTAVRLIGENLLRKVKENSKEIYREVKATIPMGLGKLHSVSDVHKENLLKFNEIFEKLLASPHDSEITDWIKRKAPSNIGTLGEGNHFIEIGEADDNKLDEVWLIIHSGSRNVGHKVATKYMIKASGKIEGFEDTFPLDVNSDLGKEYLAILDFGLEFALINRLDLAMSVKDCIETVLNEPIDFEVWTNKNHNHAVPEIEEDGGVVYIHRKGATPAKKGERGVIPGNMRDGCYLVEGLGNKNFLESSSHGAGRKMSRAKAKKLISMDDFIKSMDGIVGTIKEGTLDESPDAYKDIFDVMSKQKESVRVIRTIKPLINWKGDSKKKFK